MKLMHTKKTAILGHPVRNLNVIITEEPVIFVNKSILAPSFKIIALICFIKEQQG